MADQAKTTNSQTVDTQSVTRDGVVRAAQTLARSVAESNVYRDFEAASSALRSDGEARRLLSEFQELQRKAQSTASWGGFSESDRKELAAAHAGMMENETLRRYFEAQESLVRELQELNAYITEGLGFDFADMTKPAGGCC